MDVEVESMSRRFSKNMDLCRDHSVHNPKYFKEINNGLPENCMDFLSGQLIKYNTNATSAMLKEELISLAKNCEKIKLNIEDSYKTGYNLDLTTMTWKPKI